MLPKLTRGRDSHSERYIDGSSTALNGASGPRDWSVVLASAERACCCPATPLFIAVLTVAGERTRPVDLLLCGHHRRAAGGALERAGAVVFDRSGALVSGR